MSELATSRTGSWFGAEYSSPSHGLETSRWSKSAVRTQIAENREIRLQHLEKWNLNFKAVFVPMSRGILLQSRACPSSACRFSSASIGTVPKGVRHEPAGARASSAPRPEWLGPRMINRFGQSYRGKDLSCDRTRIDVPCMGYKDSLCIQQAIQDCRQMIPPLYEAPPDILGRTARHKLASLVGIGHHFQRLNLAAFLEISLKNRSLANRELIGVCLFPSPP